MGKDLSSVRRLMSSGKDSSLVGKDFSEKTHV